MASSYSSDLKLELMATGENAGTWGDKTNTNLNLIQQAVAGFEQVTLSSGGTLALVMSDGAASNARNMVIKFATATIAASTVCTIPDSIEKFYIFDATGLTNPSNLTIKTASGSGFTLDQAKIYAAYSDGTNLKEISLDTLGGTVAAANITGTIGTSQIADDAVTFAKMQDTTTANRVLGAASAGTIGEVQVATDMIADDAVSADKLANTSVQAGSYTLASITVDAQGRLTAASTGAAGGGGFKPKFDTRGPASGTYTVPSDVDEFYAYCWAGGGGGGGNRGTGSFNGGTGGSGGFGFYTGPVTGGTPLPYAIGGGGSGGAFSQQNAPSQPGSTGGATTIPGLFTVNGGSGGNGAIGQQPGSGGASGSAPGATRSMPSTYLFGPGIGSGGSGGQNAAQPGQTGQPGALAMWDNG
jgi:hypothetical protein